MFAWEVDSCAKIKNFVLALFFVLLCYSSCKADIESLGTLGAANTWYLVDQADSSKSAALTISPRSTVEVTM